VQNPGILSTEAQFPLDATSPEPRVLLVTEKTLGEGHRSAARALAEAFRLLVPGLSPVIATTLPAHVEWFFNAVYGHTLTKNPALWGAAYETELWTGPIVKPIVSNPLRRNARRLIARYKPHIVLATHALPVHAFARIRKRGAPYILGLQSPTSEETASGQINTQMLSL